MTNFENFIKTISKEKMAEILSDSCSNCPAQPFCCSADDIDIDCKDTIKKWFNRKADILDEVEKEYLKTVLAPWLKRKDNKIKITKYSAFSGKQFWLTIDIFDKYEEDNNGFDLPTFYSKQMYVGMKDRKTYTAEELGLR